MPTKKKTPTKKKIVKTSARPSKKPTKKSALTIAAKRSSARPATIPQAPKKKFFISGRNIAIHMVIAGSAIALLLFLGVVEGGTFSTQKSAAKDRVPVTIGIEHAGPVSLATLFAKKEQIGYLSLTNRSNETIHVSVPSSWHRTEVTGAPLDQFVSSIPVFGFTRWTIPPYAGIKMLLPEAPSAVLFDSTSTYTAAVELSMVDLDTLTQSSRVVLVLKQALAPLWDRDE